MINFNSEKKPVMIWTNFVEENAINQIKNLANLPFIFDHVAIMPDVHAGYGMPIGGVIACDNVVIPNAVGVDIGCGMLAIKTNILDIKIETIKKLMDLIRRKIPVGFNHHENSQNEDLMPCLVERNGFVVSKEYNSALKQIGTLGGGNHFIEIQKDENNYVWFMIHSGSRNLGYKVAKHYNKLAQELCTKWYSNIPNIEGENGLAFLPIDSKEGTDYLDEMNYCLDFAKENRYLMSERIKEAFLEICPVSEFSDAINIHHNYANFERHFGKNVWIHRKGATSAKLDEIGIIPGSQGTSSYIVKGLGNKMSFMSCSHGAGRLMSRNEARKNLNLENEKKILNDKGIIHSIRTEKDLDEASSAYKDINTVMENQKDLVKIVTELKPLAVIKG